MQYEIKGDTLPVAICQLEAGEQVVSESGAMGWMANSIAMDTNMKGGLLKGLGRSLSGDSVFLNTFTANAPGVVAFPSSFPGKIVARQLGQGESLICQKGAFLAGTSGIDLKIAFRKKLGAGFFGGEGFILQRVSGPGLVFLEFDGHIEEMTLQAGETIKVDTGNVAMFEESVSYDVVMQKGLKNMVFGGEGLFLTTLTGPGKVYLQTMPIASLAGRILPYVQISKN
jgi:uncharacterized protein (TIGR00266 family)